MARPFSTIAGGEMKTSELIGPALDWAVAKCEGVEYSLVILYDGIGNATDPCEFSTNWAQGGPIIEREEIELTLESPGLWHATIDLMEGDAMIESQYGNTPLVAAMRCYVASKLGDEVEIPEELNNG